MRSTRVYRWLTITCACCLSLLLTACNTLPAPTITPTHNPLAFLTVHNQSQHVALPLGSLYEMYEGHTSMVFGVDWSPDGKRIASASLDGTVQVWDAMTGKHVLIYRGHNGPVFSVRWSPNGQYIASAGYDHTVQIWDAATGKTLLVYRGHTALVSTASWSPDGQLIASGGDDGTVQI